MLLQPPPQMPWPHVILGYDPVNYHIQVTPKQEASTVKAEAALELALPSSPPPPKGYVNIINAIS